MNFFTKKDVMNSKLDDNFADDNLLSKIPSSLQDSTVELTDEQQLDNI